MMKNQLRKSMEFNEGKIQEEKVFEGLVFPKTLNPPLPPKSNVDCMKGCYGASELVEMVKAKRGWLCDLLQLHSAILFRGFNVSSPLEFGQVVEAFGWDEMPFFGAISRNRVADRVYTANEAPFDQFINFHHEMALAKQFPSKIFFFCLQPPPEGGATSILPSHIVVDKMEERVPEFVSKLSTSGFIFRMNIAKENDSNAVISKTWKQFLTAEDEVKADEKAKEKLECNGIKFREDGSAEFAFGPMNPIREFEGKRVWFNTILGYTTNKRDQNMTFADGSQFPPEAFDVHNNIIAENCVEIKWQKGDVLLLDNLCVQHARRPGKAPRVILVSMCK